MKEHLETLQRTLTELRQADLPALRRATAVRNAEAAIAALSAPQPPAEAAGKPVPALIVDHVGGTHEDVIRALPSGTRLYTAPPSAPVGVEGLIEDWESDLAEDKRDGVSEVAVRVQEIHLDQLRALAQQPAAPSGEAVAPAEDIIERLEAERDRCDSLAASTGNSLTREREARLANYFDCAVREIRRLAASALAQQPAATAARDAEIEALRAEVEDYRTNGAAAVRFAPGSAHWSNELRRLFGDDARTGIDVLESRHQQELARAEQLAEALREAADDLERGIDARIVVAQLRARAALLRDQEEGK